jgi:uncharacterized membrane protein
MSNKKLIMTSAITGLLAVATSSTALAHTPEAPNNQEKCYGISKAGMNDCASGVNSCSGSAIKDNQPDAWLFVPKGLCERITGGSLKPITDTTKK